MDDHDQLRPWQIAMAIPVLQAIGFRIGLDWDGELIVEPPEALDPQRIADLVRSEPQAARSHLLCAAARARRQFVNGPRAGARHLKCPGDRLVVCVGPARWAAYRVADDGFAYLVGEATSRAKARALWNADHKARENAKKRKDENE